jgi:DNA-binding protein HU-beta
MVKTDIVSNIAKKTGVPKVKVEQVVNLVLQTIKEALVNGERIELRGFGVFLVKPVKKGMGRNPKTGEMVPIPKGKTVRFKAGNKISSELPRK